MEPRFSLDLDNVAIHTTSVVATCCLIKMDVYRDELGRRRPTNIVHNTCDDRLIHLCLQKALLPQTDRATLHVSQNLANCFITLHRNRQIQNKSYWS